MEFIAPNGRAASDSRTATISSVFRPSQLLLSVPTGIVSGRLTELRLEGIDGPGPRYVDDDP